MECYVKIWKYNNTIYDPKYWIPMDDPEDCEGLVFPEDLASGLGTIQKLVVQDIILPRNGLILLSEDTEILLDHNSTDRMNCE